MKQMLRVRAVEGRLVAREGMSPPEFLGATRSTDPDGPPWTIDTEAVHVVPASHYYRRALDGGDLALASATGEDR